MQIDVSFIAPDTQTVELNEEQERLFRAWSKLDSDMLNYSLGKKRPTFVDVDVAWEEFIESIRDEVDEPDLIDGAYLTDWMDA